MKLLRCLLIVTLLSGLVACEETEFESTWQDPATRSLILPNKSAAAFLLSGNLAVRRNFELNLANDLSRRGMKTTPGYKLLPKTDCTEKDAILDELRRTDADYAVFMRVVDRELEVSYVPGSAWYPGPYHDPFWWYDGVFYGPDGFAGPWPSYYSYGYYRTDTVVSVETLLYSVPNSKLIWAGLSKTFNPSEVDRFVKDLVSETFEEMEETNLVHSDR